jgi:transposase
MPSNILNLPAYTILGSSESDHDYHIRAETNSPIAKCEACKNSQIVGYGRIEVLVHDLPMHGKRVGIYVDARRYRCKACGKTFMETLPAVNPSRWMTERLVKWIGEHSLTHTFVSIAEEIGVAEGTVRNVFSDYVNALERSVRFETPQWMGIDEIHIIRQPRAVISNLQNNTAVNLLPNRYKKTVASYLASLPGKEEVRYVAIDMWEPYKDAVQETLPGAIVVVDKFHVQRMGNQAFDEFRRSLNRSSTADSMRKRAAGAKKDAYVFRKRNRDLSDQERLILSGWLNSIPELAEAYRLKEAYYDIYEAPSREEALLRYQAWAQGVTPEFAPAFGAILTAWRNWQPYILSYFDHRITNAFTESLNNLIRVMNRLGRGYSFDALRAKILFSKGAYRKVIKKPAFKRQESVPNTVAYFGLNTFGQKNEEKVLNYGVDIDKLVAMIEAGEI